MVNKKIGSKRSAFTMIELIFAIVIMSIAVMSLPMMVQTTSRNMENNLVQEAIFAASAELMGATSYYWDANSMYDGNLSRYSRVIDINNDCEANASSQRYRLRAGHIAQPYHRRCLEDSTINPLDTADTLFPNLNNSAITTAEVIFDNPIPEAVGYKDNYTRSVSVTRTDYIKKITVTVNNSDEDTVTSLSAYCANIGEVDYFKRRF